MTWLKNFYKWLRTPVQITISVEKDDKLTKLKEKHAAEMQKGKDSVINAVETLPKRNISEPVISFVECVKNNPKRFESNHIKERSTFDISVYSFKDKATGQQWEATILNYYYGIKNIIKGANFLSEDETDFLIKEIDKIYSSRKIRYNALMNLRERNRLKRIYCTQENTE